ncbi:MAG: 2-isopropylmalate synthase [Candidatus Micrarchaeota archaeon]|nr:2-isopropylmalate synthase [Candidatus Micrarchaeota archaeon]
MIVLDTTLRDGDQAPGVHLSAEKKLLVAQRLDELGVDVIEAGTAVASGEEARAVKAVASAGLKAEVLSFCRIVKKDVDAAAGCGVDGVHLVFPSSDLHIREKLRVGREEALALVLDSVDYAKAAGLVVELSAEDGSRADPAFLAKVFQEAGERGADRFCVCDTVGLLSPEKSAELYGFLSKKAAKPVAVHCHNDLGLATANTLAAIRAGASEFHATVNGLGERAGNAALEEVVVGLKVLHGIDSVRLDGLYAVSNFVRVATGFPLAPNKPVVGENAFSHESGIHVDGIVKNPDTYEGLKPELVGRRRRIVLGRLSGRKAVEMKLKEFGFQAGGEQLERIFSEIKSIGDKGKTVSDADLLAIAHSVLTGEAREKVRVDELVCTTGNTITPTASARVTLELNGEKKQVFGAGTGDGPVDAALKAVYSALGESDVKLVDYRVEAITGGSDALVDVKVKLRRGDKEINSGAVGTDIVMASVSAVVKGLNALL